MFSLDLDENLQIKDRVKIKNLQAKPVFNGHEGEIITELNPETARYGVRIFGSADKQCISLKQQNITKITEDDLNILHKAEQFYHENITQIINQVTGDE